MEVVRTSAREQSLLDENGELQVTSITIVELVLSLEEAANVEIPNREMTVENFTSIDSVATMLSRLIAARA
jgi:acyl carrier protein